MPVLHPGTNMPGVKLDRPWVTVWKTNFTLGPYEAACQIEMGSQCSCSRNSCLALVYSTAEYCAPVWCFSVHTHIIDMAINDTLHIVTGCLRPTPLDNLPILAGIQPAELRRRQARLSLSCPALASDHLLYHKLADPAKQPRLTNKLYERLIIIIAWCVSGTHL